MKSQIRSWSSWGCVVVVLLVACKPRQSPLETQTAPLVPAQRSALLVEPISVDSGALVTSDSLSVHGLGWRVPAGWILTPTHEHPRIAQVRTIGGLEILVFSFGRGGGGIQANFQRWREQVQFIQDSAIEVDTAKGVVRAIGRWTGNYRGGNGSKAADGSLQTLLGAVVEGPGGRVFFKVVGSKDKLGAQGRPIIQWIRSGQARS